MQMQPRDVACSCGHVTHLASKKLLCIQCGKYVFYDELAKRSHRHQAFYATTILVLALGFVAYFFVEIVLGPLLSLQ